MEPNAEFRELFVQEFLVDLNASAAYRRAGYKGKNSNVQSTRLMREPGVQAAIREAMSARSERVGITHDRVLEELALLAFSNVEHFIADPVTGAVTLAPDAPAGAMRAVQSIKRKPTLAGVEVEIKLWDKVVPLIRAGRHVDVHGFSDRIEHTGKDGAPISTVVIYELPSNGREKKA